MNALMPRLFGDVAEWFETDLPHYPLLVRPGQLIRVEDERTDKEYTLRAELPGVDPDKDIQVSVDGGVLTIQAERREQEQHQHRSESATGCCAGRCGYRPVPTPSTSPPATTTACWR